VPAGTTVCVFCGAGLAADVRLRFPWGDAAVPPSGRLALGRDAEFSSLAVQLEPFDGVSRRHAIVERLAGELQIVDLDSTNGTFIDGRRLEANQPQPLAPGARLTLGRSLAVEVLA
jgi:hypothetical protein